MKEKNSADTFHNAVIEFNNAMYEAIIKPIMGWLTVILERVSKWIKK